MTPFGDPFFEKAIFLSHPEGTHAGTPVARTINDTSGLYDFVPKKKLRRVDHFSRMALLAAGRALKDASPGIVSKETTGVIVATGLGALETTFDFLDSYIENGDKAASPTHFSNSVHNAAGAHISILYGITGPNLTISQFDMSFISALVTATAWLGENMASAVLVGTSDAFCDPLGYCIGRFARQKNIQDYSFGESAAFFLLTREEKGTRYGYFDDISMNRFHEDTAPVSGEGRVIVSLSSVAPCNEKVSRFVDRQKGTILINPLKSPTDCGMNLFLSKLDKKISYIKFGQDDMFGTLSFTPH